MHPWTARAGLLVYHPAVRMIYHELRYPSHRHIRMTDVQQLQP